MKKRVVFFYQSLHSELMHVVGQIQKDQIKVRGKADSPTKIFRDLVSIAILKSLPDLRQLDNGTYQRLKRRLRD